MVAVFFSVYLTMSPTRPSRNPLSILREDVRKYIVVPQKGYERGISDLTGEKGLINH